MYICIYTYNDNTNHTNNSNNHSEGLAGAGS